MSKLIPDQTNGHGHLDLNLLAAFTEGTLSWRESNALFAHAAECEHCREELRIHTQWKDLAKGEAHSYRRASGHQRTTFLFAAVTGMACAVLCIGLILFHQQEQPKSSRAVLSASQRLSRSGLQKLHYPITLPNLVQFRRSQFDPGHRSEPDFSTLPGPFISARLDLRTNFQAALWKSSGRKEANGTWIPKEIAVKTAWGEKRIYVDMSGAESTLSQ